MSDKGATISECGLYRYRLWRRVTASDRIACFIMLNPSTADGTEDDATIRRCLGFTQSMGCGRLFVVNLFAFRTKSPALLKASDAPIGPDNDKHIVCAASATRLSGGYIVAAWGAHGTHRGRGADVERLLDGYGHQLYALDVTDKGAPRHPLYLPGACRPFPYEQAAAA